MAADGTLQPYTSLRGKASLSSGGVQLVDNASGPCDPKRMSYSLHHISTCTLQLMCCWLWLAVTCLSQSHVQTRRVDFSSCDGNQQESSQHIDRICCAQSTNCVEIFVSLTSRSTGQQRVSITTAQVHSQRTPCAPEVYASAEAPVVACLAKSCLQVTWNLCMAMRCEGSLCSSCSTGSWNAPSDRLVSDVTFPSHGRHTCPSSLAVTCSSQDMHHGSPLTLTNTIL